MVAYVLTHGWRNSSNPSIVVPEGMRISFLADFDLSAVEHVQAAQLMVGGVAAAQTYEEGDELPNYEFEQLSDSSIARLHALNIHDLDLWVVGPEVPAFALCTGTAGLCTPDVHACEDGLLGIAQRADETHLHMMSCRVDITVPAADRGADTALYDGAGGVDYSFDTEMFGWTAWFITLDFAEQRATWESMEYTDQVRCTADQEVAEWVDAYGVVLTFERVGATAEFHAHYDRSSPRVRQRVLREFPDLAAAVRARPGVGVPANYLQPIQSFLMMPRDQQDTYWAGLSPDQQAQFTLDARVSDWAHALAAREYLAAMDQYMTSAAAAATFRAYCAKLSDSVRDVLKNYDGPRDILAA